jgi:hypothetical protein
MRVMLQRVSYKPGSAMHVMVTFLLLLLLLQSGGPMLLFAIQQQQIRREMKKRIKAGVAEEELVMLAIPKSLEAAPNNRFQRIHSREFRFDGLMYDIVRQEERGDTTFYTCILDELESELFANLHRMMHDEMQSNPDRKRQQRKATQLLDSKYLAVSVNPMPLLPLCRLSTIVISPPQAYVSQPPTPPPENGHRQYT